MSRLDAEDFVHSGLWHSVEENANEKAKKQEKQQFEQLPFEVLPQDVSQRLQGVHEPQERGIGSAAGIGDITSRSGIR